MTNQCEVLQEIASTSKRNGREEQHAVAKVASECDALWQEVARGAKRLKEEEHKVESPME